MTSVNFAQLGRRICELLEISEGAIDVSKVRDGRVLVAKVEET
jgi:hypothetical protein